MNHRFHVVAGVLACALALPVAAQAATVHVFFVRGEQGVAVHRPAPALTPARAAASALLAGPTAGERRQGLSSAVPAGSRLLGLTIRNQTATVDLTSRFATGGGSASIRERLGQLVYTLTAIPGVKAVSLRLQGRLVHVFGGEGLILKQPLTRSAFRDFVR
jgi:spore germination protein GerM